MSSVRRGWARLTAVFRRGLLDREHEDEARAHIDLAADEYERRRGVPRAEAERLARLAFGSGNAAREEQRAARGLPWLDGLVLDLRLSLRGLARDRLFTLASVGMLALALALNTAVFAVADAMLFRGYPHVVGNHRLLYLQERDAAGRCCISYADFEDWRARARSFEALAYVGSYSPIALRVGNGRPSDLNAIRVSTNTFGLLGVRPLLGRDFVAADGAPGAAQVVILNHRFWADRFARRESIVGAAVEVNGAPATVIGVMPAGFDFPTRENLWMPVVQTSALYQRGLTTGGFTAVGRLRDGVTRHQAQVELETINQALAVAHPATNRGLVPTVASHSETMSGRAAPLIWGSLLAAASVVFLIACANLTNLNLVRTVGRWREFSTRMALGAGQARLMRQIAIESCLLAAVASAVAWGTAGWSIRQWSAATRSPYQILDYSVDSRTLAYLLASALASVVVMAIAPLARVRQLGSSTALISHPRGMTQDPRSKHLTAVLLGCQMALAVLLLSSAGLLVRSFGAIVGAETGVTDPDGLLVGSLRLPSDRYGTADEKRGYFERLEARLTQTIGVQDAVVASTIPVRFALPRTVEIEGRPAPPESEPPVAVVAAGPGYVRTVGSALLNGREFDGRDHVAALPVAMVNQRLAARHWPGELAVGKRLRTIEGDQPGPWRVVVGVASNIMQSDPLRQEFKPIVYLPFRQSSAPVAAWFLLRTIEPPDLMAEAVRAEIRALDPEVPLTNFGSLAERFAFDRDAMDAEHSELGKHATVTPVFAVVALLLAAGGLTAVMAHAVNQRTTELGVRLAIGATARDIRGLIVRDGMRPVAVGLVVGLAASVAVAHLLRSQLVAVSPYDPATFAAAALALLAVALLACDLPARRAMRIDPITALRHD